MVAPFIVLTGRLLSWSSASGLLFSLMLYSKSPIFSVPAGTIWFCCANAFATSVADSRSACNAWGSRSI
ncbi:hypothetical protein SBC1_54940 (plasmid) [Caballeronia sp. SBC1]|nr:hypothetical protein SBC1_54940 [Caballeronia sp. SBC1]